MATPYSYRTKGRSPVTWAAAILHIPLFWLSWEFEAPYFLLGIWAISGSLLAWLLFAARPRGLHLDDKALVLNAWINPIPVLLERIRRVEFSGEDTARLVLADGRAIKVDSRDQPEPKFFAQLLEARGIPVNFV